MFQVLAAFALLLASVVAHAEESNWRVFAGLGYADGGDTIVSGNIVNVTTHSVLPYQIKAGTAFQERIGAEFRVSPRFTLQGSIGHSVNSPMGYDGSLDFTVIPVEIMGFVEVLGGFRVGAGMRQSSAEMRGTGKASNWPVNGTYVSSQGAVLELQYLFANGATETNKSVHQFGLSVRSVTEKFASPVGDLNGDHYALGVVLYY